MGEVLHGSAKTTEAVRIAIKNSQENLKTLAEKYAINPKTVAAWKKRETATDARMGPKNAHLTTLTLEKEAALRKHTLLTLDDCALQSQYV